MTIFKSILCISCLGVCLSFVSCDPCGDGGDFYNIHTMLFHVLDKTSKQNLLASGQTKYGIDSVKILNANGSRLANSQVHDDGTVIFTYVDNADKGKVNQIITKKFYMHFDQQDNDTIDVSFNTHYTKCHDQELTHFKISYNDSVYFDANTDHPPLTNFLK